MACNGRVVIWYKGNRHAEVGKAPARRRHNERLMQGASGVAHSNIRV